jgi:hypothetical protein
VNYILAEMEANRFADQDAVDLPGRHAPRRLLP